MPAGPWIDVDYQAIESDTTGAVAPNRVPISWWSGLGTDTDLDTARANGAPGGGGIGSTTKRIDVDYTQQYEMYEELLSLHWDPLRPILEGIEGFVDWSLAPPGATVEFQPFDGNDLGVPAGHEYLTWPFPLDWIQSITLNVGYSDDGYATRNATHFIDAWVFPTPVGTAASPPPEGTQWIPGDAFMGTLSTPSPFNDVIRRRVTLGYFSSSVALAIPLGRADIGVNFSDPARPAWSVVAFADDELEQGTTGATGLYTPYGLRMQHGTQVTLEIAWRPPSYRFVTPDWRPPLAHRQRHDGVAAAGPPLAQVRASGARPPLAWRQNSP